MRFNNTPRLVLGKTLAFVMMAGMIALCEQMILAQTTGYGPEQNSAIPKTAKPFAADYFGGLKNLTRFGVAISQDNNECYYAVATNENNVFHEEIRVIRRDQNGGWSKPQPMLPGEKRYKYVDPHFSPDGQRLYFIYTRPADPSDAPRRPKFDIWYVQRKGDGWGDPVNVPAPISTNNAEEYYVSLTSAQKMFFGSNRADNNFDLYSAQLGEDQKFEDPIRLKGSVNTDKYEADVFVAADESYIIFSSSGRTDGLGNGDLYVSFKDSKGNWGPGINLGEGVNSNRQEFAPSISRDQKVLFFSRGGVIHWISTSVIEKHRR